MGCAVQQSSVLAATGIGYAYTAQYTSDDNAVTADYGFMVF